MLQLINLRLIAANVVPRQGSVNLILASFDRLDNKNNF